MYTPYKRLRKIICTPKSRSSGSLLGFPGMGPSPPLPFLPPPPSPRHLFFRALLSLSPCPRRSLRCHTFPPPLRRPRSRQASASLTAAFVAIHRPHLSSFSDPSAISVHSPPALLSPHRSLWSPYFLSLPASVTVWVTNIHLGGPWEAMLR